MAVQQWQSPSTFILFQAFDWYSANQSIGSKTSFYESLRQSLPILKSYNISHIWLPPPADSQDYYGYIPRQLRLLDSSYGKTSELNLLVSEMRDSGIGAIYDAVFNHRGTGSTKCEFVNPNWPSWFTTQDDEACQTQASLCYSNLSNPPSSGCSSYNIDTGGIVHYARDMDFKNPAVLNAYRNYQCQLRATLGSGGNNIPYSGARFDFVRGYAREYLVDFAGTWAANDNNWCTQNANNFRYPPLPQQDFCVVENFVGNNGCDAADLEASLSELLQYVSGLNCGAFDFITKYALTCALNYNLFSLLASTNGTLPGLISRLPLQSVTFVDNHDTGDSNAPGQGQRLVPFNTSPTLDEYVSILAQANAYIFTHPGVPSLYRPHVLEPSFGDLSVYTTALSKARTLLGIKSNAGVYICFAQSTAAGNLYAAYIQPDPTISTLYSVAMKIGGVSWWPKDFLVGQSINVVTSGPNFAVWSKPDGGVVTPNCTLGLN